MTPEGHNITLMEAGRLMEADRLTEVDQLTEMSKERADLTMINKKALQYYTQTDSPRLTERRTDSLID